MEKISVTLRSEQVRQLSDLVGDEYDDRSKAVRALLDRGFEYEDVAAERDRLREQLAATNARAEDVGELVEYVERERELQRRERERRDAPAWRRAKWWLFGRG